MLTRFLSLSESTKGVVASIIASCLFALMPLYVQFQPEFSHWSVEGGEGHWIASQRVIWSALFMMLVLNISGRFALFWRAFRQTHRWHRYLFSALLVGPQYWIFVWAPLYGETLSVALGYFSLPLVLVLVGRFVYGDKLSPLQTVACIVAAVGVAYAYMMADGLSWIVLLIALGYPVYFVHRRSLNIQSDVGFTLDNVFLLPFALSAVFYLQPLDVIRNLDLSVMGYYVGLAITGSVPMLLFLFASQSLSMSLFGLLGYVEPVLVFVVGLLLGERVATADLPTYLLVMAALMILAIDGVRRARSHGMVKAKS
ncbi:EamA family transporter RarD [Vibrio methylphosphonaticus]|uniref:EamA family transporter RarD n=1 Tax=Vibrio methylphosphonaticus TaxID=2946866 RepID=UPI002029F943|nr:EamA family transporter RarD [Vibrio methylphosphonaticus]MCL9775766.1 EamA family transporter RarD [Vibrio methylphosphonaticus]